LHSTVWTALFDHLVGAGERVGGTSRPSVLLVTASWRAKRL
jgi:hypothetical protein